MPTFATQTRHTQSPSASGRYLDYHLIHHHRHHHYRPHSPALELPLNFDEYIRRRLGKVDARTQPVNMRLLSLLFSFFLAFLAAPSVSAIRLIKSNALNVCQDSNNFTATYFAVTFTPNNRSLAFSFDGVASISGKMTAELRLNAYGIEALRKEIDPCKENLQGLCPMNTGPIDVKKATLELPQDVVDGIPGACSIKEPILGMSLSLLTISFRDRIYCSRP